MLLIYLFPLFLTVVVIFMLWFIFKAVLPMKQKMRKDAYIQALREFEAEKRKEDEN